MHRILHEVFFHKSDLAGRTPSGFLIPTSFSHFNTVLRNFITPKQFTSVEENKLLIRNYIKEIINTGNIASLKNYLSYDYSEVHEGKSYPIGLEGAKEHILGVRKTYPDLELRIDQQIAEGEWVATSITASGTHKGEWLGIKPTGKKVTYTGVNINRVVNGKIVEHGGAANMLIPLLDIGAVKVVDD